MKPKKSTKAAGIPSLANPEIEQIEQLIRLMAEHNLEEFEYCRGEGRSRLKKPSVGVVLASSRAAAAPEIIVAGGGTGAAHGGAPSPSGGAAAAGTRAAGDPHMGRAPVVGRHQ